MKNLISTYRADGTPMFVWALGWALAAQIAVIDYLMMDIVRLISQ